MTLRIVSLAFFALTLGVAQGLHAHNGHIVNTEPVSEITIDGDLSDWPKEMKSQFISSTLYLCDGTPDREGFKGRYRVGCDYEENALYIAFEIEDDSIVLDPIGDEAWSHLDGCQIFLSLDHAGEETAPVQFVYRDKPASLLNNSFNKVLAKHAKAARSSDDTHLTYEWRIDISALSEGKFDLSKGAVVGFDVAYLDRDTADGYGFYSSSPGVHKHLHSHQLGDLVVPQKDSTKLVQLAGRAAWADAAQQPLKSVKLQSLASEATLFQLPLAANGQFMLTLPAGDYTLVGVGHQPDKSTRPHQLSISEDTLLTKTISFELAKETETQGKVGSNAIVHFDLAHGQRPLPQLETLGKKLGFSLRVSEEPISSETLQNANLLYLLGPTSRFADSEKASVIEFVRKGGSLLLVVDESRRSSLSETQANDLIAPFEMQLTGDTEYVHNCGAIAKSGPIKEPCEIPFSGGRAVEGGAPFGFQLDHDGNPSHPFATAKEVTGGGKVIVLSEAMAAIFLGTPDGERLSGTPRNYAETTYWGKDSERFNTDIMTWLLSQSGTKIASQTQATRFLD